MEQEIDLKQLWGIIKKRWWFYAIFPLLAALVSGAISFYLLTPVYQSSTTLIVGKKAAAYDEQSALLEKDVLAANRQLAETYSEIAKSRTVKEQVINKLDLRLTTEQLNSKISVSQVNNTEMLKIVVIDTDPELAAEIANTTVQKFEAAVIEIMKVDSVSIIDKAIASDFPIKPNKKMNILLAFTAGIVLSFVLSLLLEFLDDTFNNTKDVEEILGLSVLGVIPNYNYAKDIERKKSCANTT